MPIKASDIVSPKIVSEKLGCELLYIWTNNVGGKGACKIDLTVKSSVQDP